MQGTVVVVPAFREARVLGDVVVELRTRFDDVVVVDDGSDDDTSEVARASGATVLRHAVNQGQGAALQTGFDFVLRHRPRARHIVTFDADGQHLVSDAVRMVEHARDHGLDVVLASRFLGSCEDMPAARGRMLRAAVWFSRRTSGLPLTDTHNGLRVLSRGAVASVRLTFSGMAHASELEAAIGRGGLTWQEVPTTVRYTDYSRAKGQSRSNALNIVFDLTARRLRVTS